MARRDKDQTAWNRQFRAVPIQVGQKYRAKRRRTQFVRDLKFATIAFASAVTVGVGVAWVWNSGEVASQTVGADPAQPQMALCGSGPRINCIVDGDTIWLRGSKIRIADIDTPEVGSPQCDYEYDLGMEATYRLRGLLNEGPWSVEQIGNRDTDQYDRQLRVLTRNGHSIGDMLVAEGLARTWTGRREPWC